MVVPLVKPVLVSLTIFTFITCWNDFLWPLVTVTDERMQTLTLAIAALKGNYSTNYGLVMAGSTLAFLPPFLFVCRAAERICGRDCAFRDQRVI